MQHFYNLRRGMIDLRGGAKFMLGLLFFTIAASFPLTAAVYNVNTTGDTHAANPAMGPQDGVGNISLRSALEAATATAGSHTINLNVSGTITLTLGQITVGNAASGNNIDIKGPGMNVLIINQTTRNRIFSTGTGAVTFKLEDVTLNYTGPGPTTGSISGGGGAIIAGGAGASTTLVNTKISNFNLQLGNGGAVAAAAGASNHSLTITNCEFVNNLCGGAGGAVSYSSAGGTCTITGSMFTNNSTGTVGISPSVNTGGTGGAVNVTGNGAGGTYTITRCSFTNNHSESWLNRQERPFHRHNMILHLLH